MVYRVLFERCERVLFSLSRSLLITAVGSGIFKQTTAFVRFPFFWQNATKRSREREKNFFFSRLLRQYAAIRCNCYFDWRTRPKIQPIIYIEQKEKFISIFYCLLLLQLTLSHMHPCKIVKKHKRT